MLERLQRCDAGQRFFGESAERPTRGGQDQPLDVTRLAAFEALQDRAVLAVHGNQLPAAALERARDQRATRHQRFLVGEGETFPCFERGKSRLETGSPHHGVDDDVRGRVCGRLEQRLAAGLEAIVLTARHQHGKFRRVLLHLPAELRFILICGERYNAKLRAVAAQDSKRAPPDRTSRAEDGNAAHQLSPSQRRNQYETGIAKKSASNRSRTPPCPGNSLPESFTPASRLSSDSTRSPICATLAMTMPPIAHLSSEAFRPTCGPMSFTPNRTAVSKPPTSPAIEPSTVLPGLTRGISLCRPIALPTKYARVSLI